MTLEECFLIENFRCTFHILPSFSSSVIITLNPRIFLLRSKGALGISQQPFSQIPNETQQVFLHLVQPFFYQKCLPEVIISYHSIVHEFQIKCIWKAKMHNFILQKGIRIRERCKWIKLLITHMGSQKLKLRQDLKHWPTRSSICIKLMPEVR